MTAQREPGRLIGRRVLVGGLQAVGLDGVVLKQQRHLQLSACTRQDVHPPEEKTRK